MKFKSAFLSQLFGSEPEKVEETKQEEPEQTVQRPSRHLLELPVTHSLHRLWSIRSEQAGFLPLPLLCLEGPDDPPLPEKEAAKELFRLKMAVNASANERLKKLRPQKAAKEDGEAELPDLDALAVTAVSQDGLTAWLLCYPPVGAGRELDGQLISEALEKQSISFGLDEPLLAALPEDDRRYFRLFRIARGTPAVHGTDGSIVDLFSRDVQHQAVVDEHNRVDYMNLNLIHNVEEGGVICRILPPTPGQPGRTVSGQEIPARDGREAVVPKGRGTAISEDGSALIALTAGDVEFSGRGFQVKPVLNVPGNVDYSVGNINFLGDVNIRGDVCRGFTVRATGSITVGGVVEACSVEAGRDLIVAKGIQGDNQAVVRAQRSIYAKYIENSSVYARQSITTDCIVNCEVYCDGAVSVRSGHRSIIGGRVQAAHEISAGIIGNRVGGRTEIILGGFPCDEFDYEMLKKEIAEGEHELARTQQQPDSPDRQARLGKLRMQLVVSRGKLAAIQKEREQLAGEPPGQEARRMLCDVVYPGTVLVIDEVIRQFTDQVSPCTAVLIGDTIHLS